MFIKHGGGEDHTNKWSYQQIVRWSLESGFLNIFIVPHSTAGKVDQGVQDKRYSVVKLTQFEFTVSVSDATFKDGGVYTCNEYDYSVINHRVEVTVLGEYNVADKC